MTKKAPKRHSFLYRRQKKTKTPQPSTKRTTATPTLPQILFTKVPEKQILVCLSRIMQINQPNWLNNGLLFTSPYFRPVSIKRRALKSLFLSLSLSLSLFSVQSVHLSLEGENIVANFLGKMKMKSCQKLVRE
jgi:hypothetical protein